MQLRISWLIQMQILSTNRTKANLLFRTSSIFPIYNREDERCIEHQLCRRKKVSTTQLFTEIIATLFGHRNRMLYLETDISFGGNVKANKNKFIDNIEGIVVGCDFGFDMFHFHSSWLTIALSGFKEVLSYLARGELSNIASELTEGGFHKNLSFGVDAIWISGLWQIYQFWSCTVS